MLPSRRRPFANAAIGRIIARAVRKAFHAVLVGGREHLAALDPKRPLVLAANHTNWWDGFVLHALHHREPPLARREFYLPMEAKNLRRYFFFPWLGVFGVDLDDPAGAAAGLRHAVRLLRGRPDRAAWFFAQGALLPPRRSITAQPGAPFLARTTGAHLLTAILRYEWLRESRATVFIRFGPALPSGADADALATAMNALAAETDAAIDAAGAEAAGFTPLFAPRVSMNRCWERLLHRLRGGRGEFNAQN